MSRLLVSLVFLSLFLTDYVNGYKILVISPIIGHSHPNFMGRLADILTENGHDVTVLMPIMDLNQKRNGLKLTKKFIISEPSPEGRKLLEEHSKFFGKLWEMKPDPLSMLMSFGALTKMFTLTCDNVISNSSLIEFLKDQKFDLGLAEPFHFCGFGLLEVLGLPVTVGALSTVQLDFVSKAIGEPVAYSYVPGMVSTYGNQMNFHQRMMNTFESLLTDLPYEDIITSEHQLFVKRFGNFRKWQDIISDMAFLFTNSNPYLNYPRPVLHKTVEIGSIAVDVDDHPDDKLDTNWDQILNERNHTVFVSFGSMAKSVDMPEVYKKSLLAVFHRLPNVTFIWKYEKKTTMADHLPNAHLVPWLPQIPLLKDPRLSVFITHGGLGSTTELSHIGKPAIFVPLFAEQPRNAQMLSRHGGALVLQKDDLANPDVIIATINKILNNPQYATNAKNLAEILNNQPIDVKQKFMKHVEFAARFGKTDNLVPYGRTLSTFQYYLVDVALFVTFVVVIVCLLVVRVVYWCLSKRSDKQKRD